MIVIIDLQTIHSKIDQSTVQTLSINLPHRNKRSAVLFPCRQNRQIIQIHFIALLHNLLAAAACFEFFRENIFHGKQIAEHSDFFFEPLRRFHVEKLFDFAGYPFYFASKKKLGPGIRTKKIHNNRGFECFTAFTIDRVGKEKCFSSPLFFHFSIG